MIKKNRHRFFGWLTGTAAMALLVGCDGLPFRVGGMDISSDPLIATNRSINSSGDSPANNSILPARDAEVATTTTTTTIAPEQKPASSSWQKQKINYRVAKGDTIYSLAKKFDMQPKELMAMNKLTTNSKLQIGQQLVVVKKTLVFNNDVNKNPINTDQAFTNQSTGTGFLLPIKNARIVTPFGGKNTPDGVVLVQTGSAVVAASDNGRVIYVGNDLKHLGLLVLVKHDKGFVTAYGYLQKSLVSANDTVARGQAIATVAQDNVGGGGASLYFEMRKHNRPINPVPLLAQQ